MSSASPAKSTPTSRPSWIAPLLISGFIGPVVSYLLSRSGSAQLSFSIPPFPPWLVWIFLAANISLVALIVFLGINWLVDRVKNANILLRGRWLQVAAGISILCIVLSAASIIGFMGVLAFPPPAPPELHIITPPDNSTSGYVVSVNGTWRNVPDDQQLWLLVSHSGLNYSQPGPVERLSGGTWSGLAYLGKEGIVTNDTYYISAVLADSSASRVFSDALKKDPATVAPLPQGAKTYDTVAVTRTR